MYKAIPLDIEAYKRLEQEGSEKNIFTTYEWLNFLSKNQRIVPVILQLEDEEGKTKAYFVGGLIRKNGFKILGSPFEGWLTCEMGFIKVEDYDVNLALRAVARYAFESLKCHYVQITDYSISDHVLDRDINRFYTKLLYLDIAKPADEILQGFTKNGRRDVRASLRKEIIIEKVPFNRDFIDAYYEQLIEVFGKQGLRPFYSIDKLYDLSDAFLDDPQKISALIAKTENGENAGTVFSVGFGEWAYYLGAASCKKHQRMLPNEALFWSFIEHWRSRGVKNIDLVGYREYKLKYSPQILDVPVVYFERFLGIYWAKNLAKKFVKFLRKVKGK